MLSSTHAGRLIARSKRPIPFELEIARLEARRLERDLDRVAGIRDFGRE